jgi:hypothetical protein
MPPLPWSGLVCVFEGFVDAAKMSVPSGPQRGVVALPLPEGLSTGFAWRSYGH